MIFESPGYADALTKDLKAEWNAAIEASFREQEPDYGSRFFTLNPATITNPTRTSIKWFGNPAEPNFCFNDVVAQQLSDWGIKGRHRCHNEYCEYSVVYKKDKDGNSRPKRATITTELREYWMNMAIHDPAFLRDRVLEVLGMAIPWEDLYGQGVTNPLSLDPRERRIRFARQMAGHGNERDLANAGVPAQPIGRLNTENIIFMTHPINGLDDLLYIVMFGAHPYAKQVNGQFVAASKEAVFREAGVTHLACRNADPAAATGAHAQAIAGRTVAFDNPLGVYILSFTSDVFSHAGKPLPKEWTRFSRGRGTSSRQLAESFYQRLEFGPGDDEDVFLDQIMISIGADERPLAGGYDIVSQLEVGPKVVIGEATPVNQSEYVLVTASDDPIVCRQAAVCTSLLQFKKEYDEAHGTIGGGLMVRPRGRVPGR